MDTVTPQTFAFRTYSQADSSSPVRYKMEGMYVIEGEEYSFLILETFFSGPKTSYKMHFFKSFGSMIDTFMEELRRFIVLEISFPELHFDTTSTIGYVESIDIDEEMQRPWFQAKLGDEIDGRIAKSTLDPRAVELFKKFRAKGT